MKGSKLVVGVFSYLDDLLDAISKVKQEGKDYKVYSPTALPEIEEATMPGKSNVRRVTLTGAVTGLCCGFALAILTSMDYPLRVSSKDIVAIPSFVVVGYECTILFGALATLLGVLHFCRLPNPLRKAGYDPRFSDDKFGLVVGCGSNEFDGVKDLLSKSGAEEVRLEEGI